MITKFRLLLTLAIAASIVGAPSFAVEKPLRFTPENGFDGQSEGTGTLTFLFGNPRPFRVVSRGKTQANGVFRLDQRIYFQGKQPRDRVWFITNLSSNHYSATLSDAAGPVKAATSGSRFTLRYRAMGPLFVRQDLTLMPDGKTIDNVGVITLLGVPVGRLRETIIRKGPGLTSNNSFNPMPLRGTG